MPYRIGQELRILMVDDSPEDVLFVRHALEKSQQRHVFHSACDGLAAVSYLQGSGPYADRNHYPFPNILLCDLKMPRMDGRGLLKWLHEHPDCKVPTIVFSSSAMAEDIHECYVLGANAYIQKPVSAEELSEIICNLCHFWSKCLVPDAPQDPSCS